MVQQFVLYRKLRHSEASQLLINLSFALLGLYVTFMFAAQGTRLSVPFCGIIGVLLHYFFLVVLFAMAAEAIDLFVKLVIVLGPKIHNYTIKATVTAWSEFNYITFIHLIILSLVLPLFIVPFTFAPDYTFYIHNH